MGLRELVQQSDSHTLPPHPFDLTEVTEKQGGGTCDDRIQIPLHLLSPKASAVLAHYGICRDSERFISTYNDLQEHGRHRKSLQDSLRHSYCVPRVYHDKNRIHLMVPSVF